MTLPPLARRFAIAACTAAAVLLGSLAIPHDRAIRWHDMRSEAWARLGWMYDRIHHDPTPIDIAFIGTSHTMNGVNGSAVQSALEAAGGTCPRVANFAFPAYGRNMHWLIVRELLEHRRVRTLVLEVFENETRKAHPMFHTVAEVSDILGAPVLINLNFLGDIAKLPARQVMLGLKTLMPERFGLRREFDPMHYDGPDVDNTRQVQVGGVALTPQRDRALSRERLEHRAAQVRARKDTAMLGARFAELEYRFPRYYLDRILDLAARRGVEVKFLYLPSYAYLRDLPHDMSFYAGRGEFLNPGELLTDAGYWYDFDHLNMQGAAVLSARLGEMLKDSAGGRETGRPKTAAEGETVPCGVGAGRIAAVRQP